MKLWMISLIFGLFSLNGLAIEVSGSINIEHRQFFDHGVYGQDENQTSIVFQPEFNWFSQIGDISLSFVPFGRLDSMDKQRSHADIRELLLMTSIDDYEFRIGIGKVFWGVTESYHLVDVINQIDTIDSVDAEEKLGQPLMQLTVIKDWGVGDIFVLPYFRERTFSGEKGRLRPEPAVSKDALYESSSGKNHIDIAFRYSHSLSSLDIGFSYFYGTNREPYLQLSDKKLTPFYALMDQVGVDALGVTGDWIWKLESIYRNSLEEHIAIVSGFEYTTIGLFGMPWDLGIISEYLYDSLREKSQSLYQNDIFVGARFSVNDFNGTEILMGVTKDLDYSEKFIFKLESSSRINNYFRWNVDIWIFDESMPEDLIELSIKYYF